VGGLKTAGGAEKAAQYNSAIRQFEDLRYFMGMVKNSQKVYRFFTVS
jgi:hypothetical protein